MDHDCVFQSLSRVRLFATPWTAARQASLSFTISESLLKLMSIESVISSNHLILCHPLLPLASIFPSIRVFSNESALCIRWPKYWCFRIIPSKEYSWTIERPKNEPQHRERDSSNEEKMTYIKTYYFSEHHLQNTSSTGYRVLLSFTETYEFHSNSF